MMNIFPALLATRSALIPSHCRRTRSVFWSLQSTVAVQKSAATPCGPSSRTALASSSWNVFWFACPSAVAGASSAAIPKNLHSMGKV
jgi:hypothetical protein